VTITFDATPLGLKPGTTHTATVSGLTPGATYNVTIVEQNAAGRTTAAAPQQLVMPASPPPSTAGFVTANVGATV